MDIKYIGHSTFFLKTKSARVVTDPFDPKMLGLKFPKTEADIVTISHQHEDHNFLGQISGNPLIIDWPGQYEKFGVRITGYQYYHDKKKGEERGKNTLYKIEDDIAVLHCGDIGDIPDDSFLEELGEIDVLMVPVGGTYTLDSSEALELVKKIEPSIVIPMHYKTTQHTGESFQVLTPISDFLKKIGAENVTPIQKLTVKKDELQEEMKVIVLESSV